MNVVNLNLIQDFVNLVAKKEFSHSLQEALVETLHARFLLLKEFFFNFAKS